MVVAANVLHKRLRTADEGWSSIFGLGRGANSSSPQRNRLLLNVTQGLGRIVWNDLS
jgi:hypothetical protein